MMRHLTLGFALLSLASCAEVRVHRTLAIQKSAEGYSDSYRMVLLGFHSMSNPVSLLEHCPNGWEDIIARKNTFQSVVSVLSLNLYSPWTVEVTCSKK